LLPDHYPDASKTHWNFYGIYAAPRHVLDSKFASILYPRRIGCLPSKVVLDEWNKCEAALVVTDKR
jgi:formamidase